MPESAESQRFFFVHVMKTAGITFVRHVRPHFPRSALYPGPRDPDKNAVYYDVRRLQNLSPERLEMTRFINGHFPYVTSTMLPYDYRKITILRDPVERTISYLKHCRRQNEDHRDLPLEAIYEDPFRYPTLILNHQTKVFSFTAEDDPDSVMDLLTVDEDRLEIAKQNLEQVEHLGLQEHFDEFVDDLHERYGWHRFDVPDINVSTEGWAASPELRRRIVEDNEIDLELYHHAQKLYERRRARTVSVAPEGGPRRDRPDLDTTKLFFIHVMKTGGTTLVYLLREHYGKDFVYPTKSMREAAAPGELPYMDIEALLSLPAEDLERFRVFTGHFPYEVSQRLGVDVATLTCLRDPVDRTISYLRHALRYTPQYGATAEEIYEHGYAFPLHIHNLQTRVFSLRAEDKAGTVMQPLDVDTDRLREAKANLEQVAVIGLHEQYEQFLDDVTEEFGVVQHRTGDKNVSENDLTVSDALRRRIVEDNAHDIELYEFARELVERQRARRRRTLVTG